MERRKEQRSRGASIVAILLLVAIAIPFVYLASTGPVIWLHSHGMINSDFYLAYTTPLGWLVSAGVAPKSVVVQWIELWRGPK